MSERRYFAPLVRELLENPKEPDREFLTCLLRRLRPLAELKLARLHHPKRHDDPPAADRTTEPRPEKLGRREALR